MFFFFFFAGSTYVVRRWLRARLRILGVCIVCGWPAKMIIQCGGAYGRGWM